MKEPCDLKEWVRDKWYAPIIDRIEKFENDAEILPEIAALAEEDSPEWAFQCAIKVMRPFGKLVGIPFDGEFDAKQVGAIIGSKASICKAMSDNHRGAAQWNAKARRKFEDIWGEEATNYALQTWARFAEKLQPGFEEIRRFAVNLAMNQDYFEDVAFHTGLHNGLTFMLEVRKTIRKAVTKAERDAQKRAAVYLFGVCAAEAIDANREGLSWPDLSEEFNAAFEYDVELDEDTFKKILQRCGLHVGKRGRKVLPK